MTLQVKCLECHNPLAVKDSLAGKRIKCPKCTATFQVPDATGPLDAPTHCSGCDAPLADDAVVCVDCGFDLRTGRYHGLVKKRACLKRPQIFQGVFPVLALYFTVMLIPVLLAGFQLHPVAGIVLGVAACCPTPWLYRFGKNLVSDRYKVAPALPGQAPTFSAGRYVGSFCLKSFAQVSLKEHPRVHVFKSERGESAAKGAANYLVYLAVVLFTGGLALPIIFLFGLSSGARPGQPPRVAFTTSKGSRGKALQNGIWVELPSDLELKKVIRFLEKNTDLSIADG